MLTFFYPMLALQAFCLYHASRNRSEQRWYYIIIFLPYVGCALYLFDTFYSKRSVSQVTEVFNQVVNSNYKIEQLEREAQFNNSATNNTRLADAYVEAGRYAEAAALYEECRVGFMADDEGLGRKLVHAWYLSGDFQKSVDMGNQLSNNKEFNKSLERISLAWALHKLGRTEEARKHFDDMNRTFTNYVQRVAYCDFHIATNNMAAAKDLANELASEFDMMRGPERRLHREEIRQVANLQQSLGR